MFYVEFVKKQERRAPLWPAAMSTTVKIFLFVGSLLHTLDLLRTKILGQVKTPSGRPRNPSSLLSATPLAPPLDPHMTSTTRRRQLHPLRACPTVWPIRQRTWTGERNDIVKKYR